MMGAPCIFVMVLLTTTAAEEIAPNNIFSTEANKETVTHVVENQKGDTNKEGLRPENLSTTMQLILFRPYIPEIEDFGTDVESKSNGNNDIKVGASKSEPIEPDGQLTETSTTKQTPDHVDKRYITDEYTTDVKYPLKGESSASIDVTSKPFARYEITENVIDVPDDRTLAGPVIHNFSPYRNTLLNLGSPKNDTEVKTETGDEDHKNSKSRLSILHIKAQLEEEHKDHNKIKNFFRGVKNYIGGIKTGVIKGIHKLFKHEKNSEGSDENSYDNSSESNDSDETLDGDHDDFAELHQTIHKGFI